MADRSFAGGCGARRATSERLLGPEIELAGYLFESQAVHDLRVYAQAARGAVRFSGDARKAPEANDLCGALVVVIPDTPTYTRSDGVVVTSLAALGPWPCWVRRGRDRL